MNPTVSEAISSLNEASNNGKTQQDQQREVLAAARQIVSSLEDPTEKMIGFVFQPLLMAALEVAVSSGILDHISVDESKPTSLKQLARGVKADEDIVKRILLVLCAAGMLREPRLHEFAHTPASQMFIAAPPVRAMVLEMIDIFGPAAALDSFLAENSYHLPRARSARSAYQFYNQTDETFYTLKRKRGTLQSFNDAMRITRAVAFDVSKFNWAEHLAGPNDRDQVAMLDIGGGLGQLLETVRETFPDWYAVKENKLMLQDRPDVVELFGGKEANGFQVLGKSFLEECTVAASAYVYRWVFMDQPDEQADALLQALKPAMIKGAQHKGSKNLMPQKLILVENTIPSNTSATPLSVGDASLDMIMMILSNSKCRTEEDFADMLTRNGFKMTNAWRETEDGKVEKANGKGGKVLFEAFLA